jgi:hypothetical protein
MDNYNKSLQLDRFEKEKLCHLLECSELELDQFLNEATKIVEQTDNIFDSTMAMLQKGYNVRESNLTGIMVGHIIGYKRAEANMKDEFKDMLYNSFKNNQK